MAHDIYLLSAAEDAEKARLVARRLRELGFKVRAAATDDDADLNDKDRREIDQSQAVLVLWSKTAKKSARILAAAALGKAAGGRLIQAKLDRSVTPQDFKDGTPLNLEALAAKNTPANWLKLLDALGSQTDRPDLRDWVQLDPDDRDTRAEWLKDHPDDPLAERERRERDKQLATVPPPAPAVEDAAAIAATTIKARTAPVKPQDADEPADGAASSTMDRWLLAFVAFAIGAMFMLSALASAPAQDRLERAELPAIANAAPPATNVGRCPAGEIPAWLLAPRPLETGPIDPDR